jgi:hypothetical protein
MLYQGAFVCLLRKCKYTGRFIIFFVITNIYNNKTKGPTFMELFTETGKVKTFFLQLQMFDVYTTGDTAHNDTIFKFLPHTRQHGCIDILHCCCNDCYCIPLRYTDVSDKLAASVFRAVNIKAGIIIRHGIVH